MVSEKRRELYCSSVIWWTLLPVKTSSHPSSIFHRPFQVLRRLRRPLERRRRANESKLRIRSFSLRSSLLVTMLLAKEMGERRRKFCSWPKRFMPDWHDEFEDKRKRTKRSFDYQNTGKPSNTVLVERVLMENYAVLVIPPMSCFINWNDYWSNTEYLDQ